MRENDKRTIEENAKAMYIFELLMGYCKRDMLTPKQDLMIENVFAKGAAANRLYGEMQEAYERLCKRLHPGVEEDGDIEVFFKFRYVLADCRLADTGF